MIVGLDFSRKFEVMSINLVSRRHLIEVIGERYNGKAFSVFAYICSLLQ